MVFRIGFATFNVQLDGCCSKGCGQRGKGNGVVDESISNGKEGKGEGEEKGEGAGDFEK